ncbi:AraC family transcriptional regulator [Paenibacillus humicola]|uniref:AraC family transcriptional regulator n=1 Tax=Paenibacillus humicola TaxID=3110540 RepID=UPI00237BBB81|nr:AraC family transcriptional regulator [Paenibacillus humicola]
MNKSFDPVYFGGRPLEWTYRVRSEGGYRGYYHWHQCCELLFVHEGRGTVIVNRQHYELTGGMLFAFQPFELHNINVSVSPERPYERTILYVDPLPMEDLLRVFPARRQLFAELCRGSRKERAYAFGADKSRIERIFATYERARGAGQGDSPEETSLLLAQLMTCIAENRAETPDAAGEQTAPRRPMRYSETIMHWIEEHYREEFDLERLAGELHLSKSYVSRLFRRETGGSISDYLAVRRIRQACRLLQTTSLPVERIGAEVGLPGAPYFIHLFKRIVGTTPLKYRNRA